jgi:PPE-repeat protein
MDYGAQIPEINSGRIWSGVGSGPLAAAAAAWQALAAELGSAGAAFQAVVTTLVSGPWLGPSSISMAAAAAPYVVWMLATAAQAEQAAAAAAQAAMVFEAVHAGVVPPAEIEENRIRLATLIATNFMGINTPAIAATEADYDRMWAQDATVLYGYAADAAGLTGSTVPFTPAAPDTNPAGLAAQAAAVGQAGGTGTGTAAQNIAGAAQSTMPGGMDAFTTMGPQLVETIPQVLQGLASPLTGGGLTSPLSSFQSLLGPLMGAFNNPGVLGGSGTEALGAVGVGALPGMSGGLSGLGGASAAGAGVEAVAGRAASLGGVSIPATWTAGAGQTAAATATAAPLTGSAAGASAVPTSAAGTGGMYGAGAPMAAGMGGRSGNDGPRYGNPVRVTRR